MSEEKDRVDGTADETKAETKSSDHHTEDTYEKVCFMCRRPESKAGKMITLPGNINICPDCMQKSFDTMNQNPGQINEMMNNMNNMPNIGMLDLSGLSNQIPNRQRVKKKEEKKKTKEFSIKDIPPPHRIKAMLDEYVIGQDRAKKVMSVAVYNHYKRVFAPQDGNIEIEKSNMLMIGPTGSGKTYLVQTLARLLDVPLAITDATSLTEAGYIGDDIESVVSKLLAAADNDVERAEHGIIFIDEIDKIAGKTMGSGPDISREGVQRDILPIVEGSTVVTKYGPVKTDFMLFIAAGAFHVSKISDLIPELQGRFPIHVELKALRREDFVKILSQTENAITKQYAALLSADGVNLHFTADALEEIAAYAEQANASLENIGARRLHTIVENMLEDISFNAGDVFPPVDVEVNGEYVKEHIGKELKEGSISKFIL